MQENEFYSITTGLVKTVRISGISNEFYVINFKKARFPINIAKISDGISKIK